MIYQNMQKAENRGLQKVANLTDFVENGRHKCAKYFPIELDEILVFTNTYQPSDVEFIENMANLIFDNDDNSTKLTFTNDESVNFYFFLIKTVGISQKNGYQIRKFKIVHGTNKLDDLSCHYVYHYWFTSWPDHKTPGDINSILDMSLDLLDRNCELDFDETHIDLDNSPIPVIHWYLFFKYNNNLLTLINDFFV